MENCVIGDRIHNPAYAMERIVVGKLTMVNCTLVSYWALASVGKRPTTATPSSTSEHSLPRQACHAATYDVMTNGVGVINLQKVTWLGNQRSNTGGDAADFAD